MECSTIQPPCDTGVGETTRSKQVSVDPTRSKGSLSSPTAATHPAANARADDVGVSKESIHHGEEAPAVRGGELAPRRGRRCCHGPPYRGNSEALGWALDAIPRGAALMGAAVFVSTALLNLATEAAGCETGPDAEDCSGKVFGMRPSSLLSNISLIVGVVCALLMPLVGSFVDHTKYRRAVGRISGAAVSVLVLLQIFISSETWFIIAISQILLAFSYSVHLCVVLAYLPELTEDKKELMKWNATFTAAQYLSSVLFLVCMVGMISLLGYSDDSVMSARISQAIVFLLCLIFFGYAWTRLFQARGASQNVPEDSTLVTAGFRKIYRTFRIIWSHHRAIKWCLLSVSLTEAAVAAFVTIGVTFMTDRLQFTSLENGIAILILLVSSVLGTQVAAFVSNHWDPIRSLQLCLAIWIANTSIAAAVLKGPGQQVAAYCFAVVWGMATGWVYPTERSLYCSIIPKGQDGELMGLYLCSCQILSWLPPLVFTAMNESGISMRISVASLNIFFGLSFCILFLVGKYDEAVEHGRNFVSERPHSMSSKRFLEHNGDKDMENVDAESPLGPDQRMSDIRRCSSAVSAHDSVHRKFDLVQTSIFSNEPVDCSNVLDTERGKDPRAKQKDGDKQGCEEDLNFGITIESR